MLSSCSAAWSVLKTIRRQHNISLAVTYSTVYDKLIIGEFNNGISEGTDYVVGALCDLVG
jgi:hypothetical protein